jgi:hypothetical protein
MPNAYRISIARQAIMAVACSHGERLAVADEIITDLLVALRHFCDARYIDFAECDRTARNHFEHERIAS